MRHRRQAKYFGRKSAHRKAMFRNMVTSLFEHGRIRTTVPRAKELRRWAERLITLAKDGSLHARRQALEVIMDKAVVAKLFDDIAGEMRDRNGGYTRIVRIGPRRGDAAMMCYIELVTESLKKEEPSRPKVEEEEEAVAPTVIPEAQKESPTKEEVKDEEKEETTSEGAEEEVAASEASEETSQETDSEEGKAEAPSEVQEGGQEEEVTNEENEEEEAAKGQEEAVSPEEGGPEAEKPQDNDSPEKKE